MAKVDNCNFTLSVIRPTTPAQMQLTLSVEEARFISDLLTVVAGDPLTTRRKHADAIVEALRNAGMQSYIAIRGGCIIKDHTGQVQFHQSAEPR